MTGSTEGPGSGAVRLSPERVVDVALAIVAADGIDALSMRRLGKQLGVDPMAIYHHLPNKQAVISGMVQRVFGEIHASLELSPDAPWRQQVREWALNYRQIAGRHQQLVIHLINNADAAGREVMYVNETLYRALALAGMAPRDIIRSADLIVDFIHGVVLSERASNTETSDWRSAFADQTEQIGRDRLPSIATVLDSLDTGELDVDVEFGLDVIIAGLEQVTQRT